MTEIWGLNSFATAESIFVYSAKNSYGFNTKRANYCIYTQ